MKNLTKAVLVSFLVAIPVFIHAQVAQIVFTTSEQNIEPGEISDVITVQLQDAGNNSFQTTETVDLEFTSDSLTGEFLSPSTTTSVTTIMASGTANKNFRYRDANSGVHTITVSATGRTSSTTWSVSQEITVQEVVPPLPTISVTGVIAEDTIWETGNVYILESTVTVNAGVVLTIEPGVIVKGRIGGAGYLEVLGSLIAQGTEEAPIHFTSLLDDSLGGDSDANGPTIGAVKDWRGIYFAQGANGNLSHVQLQLAGYVGAGAQSGIENNGGEVLIADSIIANNNLRGIYNHTGTVSVTSSVIENHHYGVMALGGSLIIQETIIRNNLEAGVDAIGTEDVVLTGNTFSGNKKTARIDAGASFTHSGNASTDNTNKGFEMSGITSGLSTWHSGDLPIIVPASNTVWVGATSTLTISPGSIVKFGAAASMIVEGRFEALGTEESEIYLTSLKDDTIGGDTNGDGASSTPNLMDWNGVQYWAGSTGEIAHSNISYTGGFISEGRAAIFNLGGNVLLSHISFSNNYNSDIYQTTGSTTVSRSTFSSTSGVVLQNTGTSTLDARLNWWTTTTGPTHSTNATGTGPVIGDNITFDPWLRRDPALPNPVIIVPGIMGTKLFEDNIVDDLVWPNAIQVVVSITDDFLDVLKMDINGLPTTETIIVGPIIRSLNDVDYFDGIFNHLTLIGYSELNDLFENPYDWRLDISQTSSENGMYESRSLREKIDEIKLQTGSEKVDVIAHSMGGLLFKKYLADYGGGSIQKFIDVGTPHYGAPSAYKILMYGDNLGVSKFFGLININSNRIKTISQNMSSVYQLLPSREYFENSGSSYYVLDGTQGNKRLSFEETQDYLKDAGRNSLMVDRADEFHQEIDNLNPADYGVTTYNIVGCGTPTLGQFYIWEDGDHPTYNIKMINGDGTVPLKSAEAMLATETYYVKNVNHAVMPSTSGVKELVASLLTDDENFNISSHSNLAMSSDGCQIPDGKIVSLHSPIELHIYDESDNHVGPDENGDIENEIDGVVYEVIDDNKFAYLPNGIEYTVKGSATDVGTFDTRIQEIVDGEVATTTIFADMALTLSTQVNFDIGTTIPTQIYLDHDGDEVFESSAAVSTTTAGFLEPEVEETDDLEETVSGPVFTSSGGQVVRVGGVEEVLGVATTSEEEIQLAQATLPLSPREEVLGSSITQPTSIMVEETSQVTKLSTESSYKSTAVVYKSFGYKVINFFKSIWGWFRSKL